MAHSYAYLCRKAGLPAPGEAAPRPLHTRRRRNTREEEMAWLHAELEALVVSGDLYKTPDGRYGLTNNGCRGAAHPDRREIRTKDHL